MAENEKCIICGTDNLSSQYYPDRKAYFFMCPSCGRYEISEYDYLNNDVYFEGLASYFFYNGFKYEKSIEEPIEYRFFTSKSKESCDEYNIKADEESPYHGRPVHYDKDIVNTWLPKTLSEKTDQILLKLNDMSDYIGQSIMVTDNELISLLFVRRNKSRLLKFEEHEIAKQKMFMLKYLKENEYIHCDTSNIQKKKIHYISILTNGYKRIDELEKQNSEGKIVLVAMSFAKGTENLRESIREGISKAGYIATFIDEVEHNEFITPELLSYIRKSRFVVVDLTHQNNGAYFEEGYAMGIGKPVIQLCQKDVKLHFDIAQKNTIMWETEDEIPERLFNRIMATIE